MRERKERVRHLLRDLAAQFVNEEANKLSMITVTDANISPDFKNATIFVSVYPIEDEEKSLHFLKRNRTDFRSFISSHARLKLVPTVDFAIDEGEKNRQRIDTLLQK